MNLRRHTPRILTPAELDAIAEVAALPEQSPVFRYVHADVPPGMALSSWSRYKRSLDAERVV